MRALTTKLRSLGNDRRKLQRRPNLETLEVRKLLAVNPIVNDPSAGAGTGMTDVTLLDAINLINADPQGGTITFSLTATTNTVTAAASNTLDLPAITSPVTINGANVVTLSGLTTPAMRGTGLNLSANNSTVENLSIDGFSTSAIVIAGTGDTLTQAVIGVGTLTPDAGVGVVVAGANASVSHDLIVGNPTAGVSITAAAVRATLSANTIGAAASQNGTGVVISGSRAVLSANLISGNSAVGVSINGTTATANVISNNTIGTDVTGASIAGTTQADGVELSGNSSTTTITGNLIAANSNAGISATNSTLNVIQGNTIGAANGVDLSGVYGIFLQTGADQNIIGDPLAGNTVSNTIVFGTAAADAGVAVDVGIKNSILSNAIYSLAASAGAGIVLTGGGNENVVAPAITSPVLDYKTGGNGDVVVSGTLAGEPLDGTYTIQFFDNVAPGDTGQGKTLLGSTTSAVSGGNGTFSATISGHSVGVTDSLTATATAMDGSTSAFSTVAPTIVDALVVNTPDDGNTPGTLRFAIGAANSHSGVVDHIEFQIPDPTIPITIGATALPPIIDPIVIDGTTQAPAGSRIEIRGAAGNAYSGLVFDSRSAGSLVNDLAITDFAEAGVSLGGTIGAGADTITNTFLGLDRSGNIAGNGDGLVISSNDNVLTTVTISGNTASGLVISAGAQNNTIGAAGTLSDTTPGAHNVISGNRGAGVSITGAGTSGNLLLDNYIGTESDGKTAMANSAGGVVIDTGGNTIGSSISGGGNLISGNSIGGVIVTSATGNAFFQDFLGVDATGAASVPNAVAGVILDASPGNIFGAGNVISGNAGVGVSIFGAAATGNSLVGSTIGLNAAGTAIPTGAAVQTIGVVVNGAPSTTISGALISGNTLAGVSIDGVTAVSNLLTGNTIGTSNVGASIASVVQPYGVELSGNSSTITITGNVIAADAKAGIAATNSTLNVIQHNTIGAVNGVDLSGVYGIFLQTGADQNLIGDPLAGAAISNTIVFGTGANDVGVGVDTGSKNSILSNAIYSLAASAGVGIQLTNNGNEGLLPPVITDPVFDYITGGNGDVILDGTIPAADVLAGPYTIQIFDNDAKFTSQGKTLLATTTTTLSGASLVFSATITGHTVALTDLITATATAMDGSTSAFSLSPAISDALVVNTPNDGMTAGTLRLAITAANRHAGSDPIEFELPVPTAAITVSGTALPTITDPIVIDGTTQAPAGSRIEIRGATGNAYSGLIFGNGSQNSVVNDLAITDFGGAGVSLGGTIGAGSDTITNTYIGLDRTGAAAGNSIGVIVASAGNTLSGSTISANTSDGVDLSGSLAASNLVTADEITKNGGFGVYLNQSGVFNTIGGILVGSGNTINGNASDGVFLDGTSSANLVSFNLIQSNTVNGIVNTGPSNTLSGNTIGGGGGGGGNGNIGLFVGSDGGFYAENLIIGNALGGVFLVGNSNTLTADTVSGNGAFGVAISGNLNLITLSSITANAGVGVTIYGSASGNSLTANTIAGNTLSGVYLSGPGVTNTLISSDAITNNGQYGVAMVSAGILNTVGGSTAAAGNTISANGYDGVLLNDSGSLATGGNLVAANTISTNGRATISGILGDGIVLVNTGNATIGGAAGFGNTIGANAGNGIELDTNSSANSIALNLVQGNSLNGIVVAGSANTLLGNSVSANDSIGMVVSGPGNDILASSITGHVLGGVTISGNANTLTGATVSANTIFGIAISGNSNVIATSLVTKNVGDGVDVSGMSATANEVSGNAITSNSGYGVFLNNAEAPFTIGGTVAADVNTIGGSGAAAGNLIASNGLDGIRLQNSGQDLVSANSITGNTGDGVFLIDASNNTVGGLAGFGNTISANAGNGIELDVQSLVNLVALNVVSSSSLNGIVVSSTMNTLSGNTVGANASIGVVVSADANVLSSNSITANPLGGLSIRSNFNSINGETVAANSLFGVAISGNTNLLTTSTITGNSGSGVVISGNGNTLSISVVNLNHSDGVSLSGSLAAANLISGNSIASNGGYGVDLAQSGISNTIGGSTFAAGNTIASNGLDGIRLFNTGSTATGGNLIAANSMTGNSGDGIHLVDSSDNLIGGPAGYGNTVSGNAGNGVELDASSLSSIVQLNVISGNSLNGLVVSSSSNTLSGNTVGGNASLGVVVSGLGNSLSGDSISGNRLGGISISGGSTTLTGETISANSLFGVAISSGSNLVLSDAITHNVGTGVTIFGSADKNSIVGNFIAANTLDGLDSSGLGVSNLLLATNTVLNNAHYGIFLVANGPGTTIGGSVVAAGNVVSGSGWDGIRLVGASQDSYLVANNSITGNGQHRAAGVLGDGVYLLGSVSSTIGGVAGFGNTIQGNAGNGIELDSSSSSTLVGDNLIVGNSINGIAVQGASNTIGMTTLSGIGNTIAGNLGAGVSIGGSLASANVIRGNLIGTAASGNGGDGIRIDGFAGGTTIGGTSASAANTILGNAGFGVELYAHTQGPNSPVAAGTLIENDVIGQPGGGNLSGGVLITDVNSTTITASTIASNGNAQSQEYGGGIAIEDGESTIITSDSLTANVGNAISIAEGFGIVLTGSSIVAAPSNQASGLLIDSLLNSTIGGSTSGLGNLISGFAADGIVGTTVIGSTFEFNTIQNSGYTGMDLQAFMSSITNNTIATSGNDAVTLEVSNENTISGNSLSASGHDGIDFIGAFTYPNSITNNVISGSGNDGLSFSNASNNTLSGNSLSGSGHDAILFLNGGSQNSIASNNISGSGANGIELSGDGANAVTANLVVGSTGTGLVIAESNDSAISGNTLTGGGFGAVVSGSHDVLGLDTGNLITNNTFGGVVISGNNDALIHNTIGGSSLTGNAGFGVRIASTSGQIVSGNVVAANTISGNAGPGLLISFGQDNTVSGALIAGNVGSGILIGSSSGTVVLDTMIAGNLGDGVIAGASRSSVLLSNTIGGTVAGIAGYSQVNGISLYAETNDLVIGNLIAGDSNNGVYVQGATAPGIIIQSNLIGDPFPGSSFQGNGGSGIFLLNSPGVLIGGDSAPNLGNSIIANKGFGIAIVGTSSAGNTISGNVVGSPVPNSTSDGPIGDPILASLDLRNGLSGVYIMGAPDTVIGGLNPLDRNVVSANGRPDLYPTLDQSTTPFFNGIEAHDASGTRIEGNLIGLDSNGLAVLGNHDDGIYLDGSTGTTIGGTSTSARNVISFNGSLGIEANHRSNGTLIQGNYIGTTENGTATVSGTTSVSFGNTIGGIVLGDSSMNTVGGSTAGAGNVVSGNGLPTVPHTTSGSDYVNNDGVGIYIFSNLTDLNTPATLSGSNLVQGNFIGTDATGTTAVPNAFLGVLVTDSQKNTIGGVSNLSSPSFNGSALGQGNLISGNQAAGVVIYGFRSSHASGNVVSGNLIGTDITGTKPVPITSPTPSRQAVGVLIESASSNTVGGVVPASSTALSPRNLISGNLNAGVEIYTPTITANTSGNPATAASNVIVGNLIGSSLARQSGGISAVGNGNDGIFISNSRDNLIGGGAGLSTSLRNFISGNSQNGIRIDGHGSTGNKVLLNTIGLDQFNDRLGNQNYGILISGGAIGDPVSPAVINLNNRFGPIQNTNRKTRPLAGGGATGKIKSTKALHAASTSNPRSGFASVLGRPMKFVRPWS